MSKQFGQSWSFLAAAAFLAFSQVSAIAQTASSEQRNADRFKLSAMVNVAPSLSRADIDPSAVSAPRQQLPQQPHIDKSYLEEYNVDWSHWISTQADRWFYILKSTETFLGMHFSTVRPAMIEFTCYADGSIGNIALRQSSGNPVYDRLQIEALRATSPTLPFPAGTQRSNITLCQGWESHPAQPGESDYQPGSFGKDFPKEKVRQWSVSRD